MTGQRPAPYATLCYILKVEGYNLEAGGEAVPLALPRDAADTGMTRRRCDSRYRERVGVRPVANPVPFPVATSWADLRPALP